MRLVHAAKYVGFSSRVGDAGEFKVERFWASIPEFFVQAAVCAIHGDLDDPDPVTLLVKRGYLRYEVEGHSPFWFGDKTWRVTDDVHLEVTSERHGLLEVVTVRCGNKRVGDGFEAPCGDRNCPSITLTGKGLAACSEVGTMVSEKPAGDDRSEDDTKWKPGTEVANKANKAVRVKWEWRKWKRFFERHAVQVKRKTKKDGTDDPRRCLVNVRDAVRALKVASETGEFDKMKTDRDRRHEEMCQRIDDEFGSKALIDEMFASE